MVMSGILSTSCPITDLLQTLVSSSVCEATAASSAKNRVSCTLVFVLSMVRLKRRPSVLACMYTPPSQTYASATDRNVK
ncbi:hypothetical protein MHBO_003593 [Bonamia ostreae]|uniref:Secreted protein n=1 Tax=Bonamia ostreae TaxID=126728 RepID=A0ABV2AQX5_9EUKA